jgi:LPS sulfotransferase NodH
MSLRAASGAPVEGDRGGRWSLIDPRNGPDFDLPPVLDASGSFVVASVPRSGSTLLCRLLWDTGGVGAPKEYLNPMQLRDWELRFSGSRATRLWLGLLRGPAVGLVSGRRWDRARLEAHLERVRVRRSDASGRFGIKVHYHHFERWFLERGWDPVAMLRAQRWIRIVRRDRLAQAVSWSRALQSGRWAHHQAALLPVIYRRRQIERLLGEVDRQERGWDEFFATRGIEPFTVAYESLIEDRVSTVRGVLAHLGVPGAPSAPVAEPDLARQADRLSARWIERYRASSRPSGSGSRSSSRNRARSSDDRPRVVPR